MIVQEHFTVNGRDFTRTTSDAGRYVVRNSVSYSEACDPAEFGRQYTEGDFMEDASTEDAALTRYANELTGTNANTLQEATENLIKHFKEE